MAGFEAGEGKWIDRLGNLRNTIRQELIRRQLTDHVTASMSVLDVGCGQGTQLLGLAERGCVATGVEPSDELRELCADAARRRGLTIELLAGQIGNLEHTIGGRRFDLVCAHGLLMYLSDRAAAITALANRVDAGGLLSLTFRNGHALAARPGLRGEWAKAVEAFDASSYVNELGVDARADRLDDVAAELSANGLDVVEWYGVRVFNDHVSPDVAAPAGRELEKLLDAEDLAGQRDPYRWFGSQLHVIARRPESANTPLRDIPR